MTIGGRVLHFSLPLGKPVDDWSSDAGRSREPDGIIDK